MVYGQRPKFVRAEHSATAVGEKCGYGPTLPKVVEGFLKEKVVLQYIPNLGKTAVLPVLLIAAPPTITRQSFFPVFPVSKNSSDDPPKVIQKVLKVSQKDNKFVEEQDGNKIQNNLSRKIRFRDHGPKLKANCFS